MKDNKIKILKSFQDTDFSSLRLRRDFEINSLNYLIDSGYVNIDTPVIEVHISNTKSREDFRTKSFISPHAKGIIQGFGLYSYDLAILSLLKD